MLKDTLGDRIKSQYENRTQTYLPRRTYTIIRLDGKAFHSYTKRLDRPFDYNFMKVLDETAAHLCGEIQGAEFAYLQSDEINILLTDFRKILTNAWFDGNIQKLTSISASICTAFFNKRMKEEFGNRVPDFAYFDSRAFTVPDPTEVENTFIWRQKDCTRNSIQMLARSLYSHKQLHEKKWDELNEMCFKKGINWNSLPAWAKRGRCIIKKHVPSYSLIELGKGERIIGEKNFWVSDKEVPIFTQNREYLRHRIPLYGDVE